MTPDVRQQPIEIEIPAERKWTLAVTDDVGFADIWEKGYTDEDSILTITVIPRSPPSPADPEIIGEIEDMRKELEMLRVEHYENLLKPTPEEAAAQARIEGQIEAYVNLIPALDARTTAYREVTMRLAQARLQQSTGGDE